MVPQVASQLSLSDYQPDRDRFDACRNSDGSIRTGWKAIDAWVRDAGVDGLNQRSEHLHQLILDNGATFSVEGDDQQRPWKLATVPLAIDAASWTILDSGLSQRVRLLEAVLADLLGPQRLIHERIIPADLLWSNPQFERAYHGLPVCPDAEGRTQRLHVTATDLARSSDGSWWIIGDRTRAPSGLGYLLENRIVTSQVLSQLVRQCNVQRLASFFASLRSRMQSLAPRMRDNPRIALLTPGPSSYRYFEDVFLARYLGYTLVQGSDLAVRGNRLNLKTLGGLLPIEVLWRHVSDRKCDPLELDPTSSEGVTGLLRMVRQETVSIANAIGSELAQMPALLPFLPAAAKFLFSEELKIPSIATYWCGGTSEREHVFNHIERFIIRSAYLIDHSPPIVASELSSQERSDLIDRIKARPQHYVAQETMQHATTPVWTGNEFKSWHVSLRSFHLLDGDQVEVLPGGLARVSPDEAHLLEAPTSGQLTLDCWITHDQPVEHRTTLLPDPTLPVQLARGGSDLPSRVAEHLFWLGRYVERCEAIARLLRTTLTRLAVEEDPSQLGELPRLMAALAGVGQIEPDHVIDGLGSPFPSLDIVLPASVFSRDQPEGLQSAALAMVANAGSVRDRLSVDAYRIIKRIGDELDIQPPKQTGEIGPAIERLNRLIVELLAFAGMSNESMTRTHGWRFLQLGRRIERTYQTAELIMAAMTEGADEERPICEAVLDATDSMMTYRSRYMNLVRPIPVIDLLVTDDTNPRSITFQLKAIDKMVNQLPRDLGTVGLEEDQQQSKILVTRIEVADAKRLGELHSGHRTSLIDLMQLISAELPRLSDAIVARFLFHTSSTQTLTGEKTSLT